MVSMDHRVKPGGDEGRALRLIISDVDLSAL
jgi:hypothetical protein